MEIANAAEHRETLADGIGYFAEERVLFDLIVVDAAEERIAVRVLQCIVAVEPAERRRSLTKRIDFHDFHAEVAFLVLQESARDEIQRPAELGCIAQLAGSDAPFLGLQREAG